MADRDYRGAGGFGAGQAGPGPLLTTAEAAGLGVGALWLVAGTALVAFRADMPVGIGLVVTVMPAAMIGLSVALSRSVRLLRAEVGQLRQVAMLLRPGTGATGASASGAPVVSPSVTDRPAPRTDRRHEPAAPSAAVRSPEATQPQAQTQRPAAVIRPIEEQPSLALGQGPDSDLPPLETPDLIRALNFPENDRDHDGFAALRRALKDRPARQLIQAAQDVLTLLSQDGIYTDDLRPDRARPDVWRRFAQGERGRSVAQLGGIHDRSCLALTMTRMREDTIFRDASHHFLRLFDRMLTAFEPGATDGEIAALSETRTARAFMLLGRVTGAFD